MELTLRKIVWMTTKVDVMFSFIKHSLFSYMGGWLFLWQIFLFMKRQTLNNNQKDLNINNQNELKYFSICIVKSSRISFGFFFLISLVNERPPLDKNFFVKLYCDSLLIQKILNWPHYRESLCKKDIKTKLLHCKESFVRKNYVIIIWVFVFHVKKYVKLYNF